MIYCNDDFISDGVKEWFDERTNGLEPADHGSGPDYPLHVYWTNRQDNRIRRAGA